MISRILRYARRRLLVPLSLFAAVAMVLFNPQSAMAQMGPDYWAVHGVASNDHLNIRSGPSTGNRIIAHAPNGAIFRNLGCRGSGNSRWCHLETPDGQINGWAAGRYLQESGAPNSHSVSGERDVPELHLRNSGEMEVRFASGCTVLYSPSGRRLAAGSSCSRSQLSAAHDATERYIREQGGFASHGGTAGSSASADVDMNGTGSIIGGGLTRGRLFGHSEGHYAIVVTATDDALTCTGTIQHAPGTVGSETTHINCNGGASGTGTLVRSRRGTKHTFTFNLSNGTGGFVIF